jgi:hypothetical protein
MGTCDCKLSSAFKDRFVEYNVDEPPSSHTEEDQAVPIEPPEFLQSNERAINRADNESEGSSKGDGGNKSLELLKSLNAIGSHIATTKSLQSDSIDLILKRTRDIENHVREVEENGVCEEESSMEYKLDVIHKEMSDLLKLVREVANHN